MTSEQLINYGWTLVWENESPTSEFGEQTISLDLSSYDEVAVVYRVHTTVEYRDTSFSIIEGSQTVMWIVSSITSATKIILSKRHFTPTATGVAFTNGTKKSVSSTSAETTDNKYVIPCYIYAR